MNLAAEPVIKGYHLREKIGEGGFGTVYRATQPSIGREVAVKIIHADFANQPDFVRRFEVEAQLVATLEHPHIIPLYDYWRDPDGAYLVMRFLRGGNLRESVMQSGAWSLEAAARLLQQLAAALMIAHRHHVVHRDLKPANILLDEDQNAYLTDFGIAKVIGAESNTQEGTVIGSPAYLAPEQIRGETVSPLTDIYSLGILLYEVLTGQHPFNAEQTATLIYKHLNEPVPSLQVCRPDLPEALNVVIQRATAKKPAERYPDTQAFAAAFREVSRLTETSSVITLPITPAFTDQVTTQLPSLVDNPYKGLRAFQENDAGDFYGRETLSQTLLARLQENHPLHRFLAVVGPSGSGKSSVVKAGLLPALRKGAIPGSERWFITDMLPGTRPLDELEVTLTRIAVHKLPNIMEQLRRDAHGLIRVTQMILPENSELLLVIDQFEEVFTLADDPAQAQQLLDLIYTAVTEPRSPIRVIITLRADFYDRPLKLTSYGKLIEQRTQVILPLSPDELERAIASPANKVGIHLETGLIAAIIADVNEQPGALPMFQYALTELFDRRVGNRLTLDAYQQIGRALGALARQADEVYSQLSETQQAAARQLFLRLVTLGEGIEDTRRRALLTELLSLGGDTMQQVIQQFDQARLLTFDRDPMSHEPTVEVAHEAIIREWGSLQSWLDDSRYDVRQQRMLSSAAKEWQSARQEASYLLRGSRLSQFQEWAAHSAVALTAEEQAYLDHSVAEHDRLAALERLRQAHEADLEQRTRRLMRVLIIVFATAAVIGIGLSIFAFGQRDNARSAQATSDANAAIAERQVIEMQSLRLLDIAEEAVQQDDMITAMRLLVQANQVQKPPPKAQELLLEYAPHYAVRQIWEADTSGIMTLAMDQTHLLSGGNDGTVLLWDASQGQIIHPLSGHQLSVLGASLSPDGKLAVTGGLDKQVILWDVLTGEPIQVLENDVPVRDVAFSPDGQVAVAGNDGLLFLWDMPGNVAGQSFNGHEDDVVTLAFSPDGQTLVSGDIDGRIIVWDVTTGAALVRFNEHTASVRDIVFSPDGQTAVSTGDDGIIYLWLVSSGELLERFEPPPTDDNSNHVALRSLAFSPDGHYLAAAGEAKVIWVWEIETEDLLYTFHGHQGVVQALNFLPDGTLLSAARDGRLITWDVGQTFNGEIMRLTGHSAFAVQYSPDGQYFLSGGNGTAVGDSSGFDLILWDAQTGEMVRRFAGHTDWVLDLAFTSDGRYVFSTSGNGEVIQWEVETGQMIRQIVDLGATGNNLALSPDGQFLFTTSNYTAMPMPNCWVGRMWRVATGEEIKEGAISCVDAGEDLIGAVFMPDMQHLLVGYSNLLTLVDQNRQRVSQTIMPGIIQDMEISRDGSFVIVVTRTSSENGRLSHVNLNSGELTILSNEAQTQPRAISISADETLAVSLHENGTLIVWDLNTFAPIMTLDGRGGLGRRVDFSPDGQSVVATYIDGSIRVWGISMARLLPWLAENRYLPALTPTECAAYLVENLCAETATQALLPH